MAKRKKSEHHGTSRTTLFQISHNVPSYPWPNATDNTLSFHHFRSTRGYSPQAGGPGPLGKTKVNSATGLGRGRWVGVCSWHLPHPGLLCRPPGLASAILKLNNNHNRQPIIASLSGSEVYNLNLWQREKLAQSLGVMVHGEPVGHDCYLTQGNRTAALSVRTR